MSAIQFPLLRMLSLSWKSKWRKIRGKLVLCKAGQIAYNRKQMAISHKHILIPESNLHHLLLILETHIPFKATPLQMQEQME